MNAVARRLGPYTPMALYRYVGSKDGLTDLMLDAAVAEVALPERGGDWRTDLHELAMCTWAMVRRHRWYAQLVHTRPPAGPQSAGRGGAPHADAVRTCPSAGFDARPGRGPELGGRYFSVGSTSPRMEASTSSIGCSSGRSGSSRCRRICSRQPGLAVATASGCTDRTLAALR